MSYFVVELHLTLFIGLFFILSVALSLADYFRHGKHTSLKRFILLVCFSLYIMMFLKFVILPIWIIFDANMLKEMPLTLNHFIQYIPFYSIKAAIEAGTWPLQVLGNIIMLMPVPVFLELFKGKTYSFWGIVWLGLKFSLAVELYQGIVILLTGYPSKIVDIDDVILNVAGVALAFFVLKALNRMKLYQALKQVKKENADMSAHKSASVILNKARTSRFPA